MLVVGNTTLHYCPSRSFAASSQSFNDDKHQQNTLSKSSTSKHSPDLLNFNMEAGAQASFSLADGVSRAAAFTTRPPSPPYIHVPTAHDSSNSLLIVPSYDSIDIGNLSNEDIDIITGKRSQQASSDPLHRAWVYEDRRKAQPILDFLYLGPLSVVRDRDWLQQEGITMLLAARDATMAQARLMSLEKAVDELGIEAAYVDVAGRQELIRSFPAAVAKINDHLLRVYKSQAQQQVVTAANGQRQQVTAIDPSTFRRGKVLVFCETGNERSAVVVAAYLMTMYGGDLVSVIQFISAQRFCTNFDEEAKMLLQSYGDILEARRMTIKANQQGMPRHPASPQENIAPSSAGVNFRSKKRGIGDTMDEDDNGDLSMDVARYEDRAPFQPFLQNQSGNTKG